MKTLKVTALAIAAVSGAAVVSSCASDQNPLDLLNFHDWQSAKIQLKLKAATPESESATLSTESETAISKANLYIFNENDILEKVVKDLALGTDTLELIGVQQGSKTLYAISAIDVLPSVSEGSTLADFENSLISSTVNDLKSSSDGFVMTGKSNPQWISKSNSEFDMPESNRFNIDMTRLLAKTQVLYKASASSSDDFEIGNPSFSVGQICNKMRIKANGEDVFDEYLDENEDGTYDGYTASVESNYIYAQTENFIADNCHYVSENIVKNPTSGNTTFASIRIPLAPKGYHSYSADKILTYQAATTPTTTTFCTVGIIDRNNGYVDYAMDSNGHIIIFNSSDEAQRYCAALNGGDESAATVMESEQSLRVASPLKASENEKKFEVCEFSNGNAYYRVNLGTANANVVRNKFYKITIKSVNLLGFKSEDLLRPANPEATLENTSSLWIDTQINVVDWDSEEQEVDL